MSEARTRLGAEYARRMLDYIVELGCNCGVITSETDRGVPVVSGIPAPRVGEYAGVTYRQLDHWVRQGYVTPSMQAAVGRGARRLFSAADVVAVAALGRFGRARLDISLVGPLVAALPPISSSELVVVAVLEAPLRVEVVAADELREVLARAGPCVVFDPGPVLSRLHPLCGPATADGDASFRLLKAV